MRSQIEQHDQEKPRPKLKIIVLGSGYNPLQEGDDTYLVEKMSDIQRDIYYGRPFPSNSRDHGVRGQRLYVGRDTLYNNKLIYVALSSGGQMKTGFIRDNDMPGFQVSDLENPWENKKLIKHILKIAEEKGDLDKNPFTTLAREAGYDIDVESVSLGDPSQAACWTGSSDGATEWGRVVRTQIKLPDPRECNMELAALEQRWESETHQYAGVIIINGAGEGRFFESYFKNIYSKYEELYDGRPQGTEVYFADWCTCCTAPQMIEVTENPPGPYCRNVGTDPLRFSSPLQRTRGSATHHDDFRQWLNQIENAAVQRQEIRKNFSDAMNELRERAEPSSSKNRTPE